MRCYHLNNSYLAAIHAGIQSAHSQHELAMKYLHPQHVLDGFHKEAEVAIAGYLEWASNHKTIIVLDGGWHEHLVEMQAFLASNTDHSYAWASFCESPESLNGSMTNIALVLPYHMYAFNREIASFVKLNLSSTEATLNDGTKITLRKLENGVAVYRNHHHDASITQYCYSKFDVELIVRLSQMKLM